MTPTRHPFRMLAAVLSVMAVVLVGALATTPQRAEAANAADFQPGYIISDSNFYNGSAVDAGNIQAWLNVQVPACDAGYTCLKDYRESTYSRAADAMCAAYSGVANETAATIIAKVGAACGISQKVILVLLQKEQSLVTDTSPTTGQYQKATGFACPDTGGCDTTTLGFYNQVYKAAWQFKRYSNPPGTSPYFSWIPIGQASAIRYSPNAACGSSNVVVRNQATAALYYYTPYQPNAAALANLYGTGDGCSAYGNRNFWRLYADWFGSPTSGAQPTGNFEAGTLGATTFSVSGWTFDPSLSTVPLNVQITWNTPSGTSTQTVVANLNRPDVGAVYPMAGPAHGFSASVPRTTDGQYSACLVAIAAPGNPAGNSDLGCRTVLYSSTIGGSPASSRISGSDRFDTSVAVSKAAYPASGVPVVYIASGMNFADALSAGPAAAAQKGPLLLSTGADVTASVLAEVKRLAPAKIVVVGGVNAVSAAAVAKLAALQPNVQRIAGSDRFETSRLLAQYAFPGVKGAYFASGLNFPDALSAASAAGAGGQPVVLVTGFGSTDAGTSAYASSAKLTSATIVGGTTVVSTALDASMRASGATVTRIGGYDRFDTSHLVNSQKFPTASTAYVASGVDFPDALAGSAVAGAQKAPLFVARSYCVPRSIGNDLVTMKTTKVVFIGGTTALSADTAAFRPC
ncbi:cell wall-binding repeat-containing protein [Leifsonia sp. NPDC077715]|uniref:cell wall-binding repeat-containing protein n=1 Tax=Leifsonia sp. NPDC077715 TaxID=3155539 RepID=UPI00342F64D9